MAGLQWWPWWAYMLITIGVFLIFIALNYVVKIINDNRFEERMIRLNGRISTCTQVQVPLIERETKKSSPNQETPEVISLVFTKEDNRHRIVETTSLDTRISVEDKSTNNSTQPVPLGTIYSNKRFSSHDSFGKTQSGIVKTDDHSKSVVFRTALDVRMPSPMASVESTLTYKIKESNAVENFKENILKPMEYTLHDHVSVASLAKLPERLFKEPDSDVFASKSDINTSPSTERNISKETVNRNMLEAENKPSSLKSDDIIIIKNQSDLAAFTDNIITLKPEASNASSIFNPGIQSLGNIYQNNSLLLMGSVKPMSKTSNESSFDCSGPKNSVKDVIKDYSSTSKVTDKILRINSNKTLCDDIVQSIVNKLDKDSVKDVAKAHSGTSKVTDKILRINSNKTLRNDIVQGIVNKLDKDSVKDVAKAYSGTSKVTDKILRINSNKTLCDDIVQSIVNKLDKDSVKDVAKAHSGTSKVTDKILRINSNKTLRNDIVQGIVNKLDKDSVKDVAKAYSGTSKVTDKILRISSSKTLCNDIVQGIVNKLDKDSVKDVAKAYSGTSKVTDKILRISSSKTLCNDIVQGIVNKLDKGSVKDVAKAYSDTSRVTDKILRIRSNKFFCKDIVQGIINKLDKEDEGTADDE